MILFVMLTFVSVYGFTCIIFCFMFFLMTFFYFISCCFTYLIFRVCFGILCWFVFSILKIFFLCCFTCFNIRVCFDLVFYFSFRLCCFFLYMKSHYFCYVDRVLLFFCFGATCAVSWLFYLLAAQGFWYVWFFPCVYCFVTWG